MRKLCLFKKKDNYVLELLLAALVNCIRINLPIDKYVMEMGKIRKTQVVQNRAVAVVGCVALMENTQSVPKIY